MVPDDGFLRYITVDQGSAEEEPVKENERSSQEVGGNPECGGIIETKSREGIKKEGKTNRLNYCRGQLR